LNSKIINRWTVLISGIFIQTILGGIYAWSTFVPFLTDEYGLNRGQCGFIFGLTISIFTIAMIFAGRFMSNHGPRRTALTGGILFLSGYILASFSQGNYIMLLVAIGGLVGTGIGFGYVCPLSVGMKWFPYKKGLVTGVSVAGFGGGAIVLTSTAEYFLDHSLDVLEFFRYLGIVAGSLMILATYFMMDPPEKENKKKTGFDYKDAKTLTFFIMFFGIFAGTFSGLLIVGNLSPIVIDSGYSKIFASAIISLFALGNALGRVIWGHLFDKFHFKSIPMSLGIFLLTLILLLLPLPKIGFQITTLLLGFCFGACFVVYASSITRFFGVDKFSGLYPLCFLGYGIAGLIGPGAGGFIDDKFGSYDISIYISISLVFIAMIFSTINMKTLQKKVSGE